MRLFSERESVRPLRWSSVPQRTNAGRAYAACVLGRLIFGRDAKSFHRIDLHCWTLQPPERRKQKSVAKTPQVSEGSQQSQSPVDPASWHEWRFRKKKACEPMSSHAHSLSLLEPSNYLNRSVVGRCRFRSETVARRVAVVLELAVQVDAVQHCAKDIDRESVHET